VTKPFQKVIFFYQQHA